MDSTTLLTLRDQRLQIRFWNGGPEGPVATFRPNCNTVALNETHGAFDRIQTGGAGVLVAAAIAEWIYAEHNDVGTDYMTLLGRILRVTPATWIKQWAADRLAADLDAEPEAAE